MLCAAVEEHIVRYGVTEFIVGRYGCFDGLAAKAVKTAKQTHPEVELTLLLPYHPAERPIPVPDGFVMSSLNALSHEVNEKGYFLMIKTTSDISEIPVFASMWNMDGLILMGFCEADYEKLRNQMRISFVVYDGYFEKCS